MKTSFFIAVLLTLIAFCYNQLERICARVDCQTVGDCSGKYIGCIQIKRREGPWSCVYNDGFWHDCCEEQLEGKACTKVDQEGKPVCMLMKKENYCPKKDLAFLQ
jgi:hypothetical protein